MNDSLLGKLRLIGLGSMHSILNSVIDEMPLQVLEQQIRDIKKSRDTVDQGVSEAIGNVRTLTRSKTQKSSRIAELSQVIEQILTDDDPLNDAAAKPKIAERKRLEKEVVDLDAQLSTQASTKATLEEALVLIDSRIEQMEARRDKLQSTTAQSAAKEEASAALKAARAILDRTAGSSVDSALQRAENRDVQAGVTLEREVDRLKQTTGAREEDVEVDAELARLKAEFAKRKQDAA